MIAPGHSFKNAPALRLLLVGVSFGICPMFSGCGTTERVLRTELVPIRTVRIESFPAGEVYVNGRWVGRSPVSVPVYCRRHTIARVTRKAGRNIDDALIVGIPMIAVSPPAALLALLVYGENSGFVETKRELIQRDEAVTYTVEGRHADYLTARTRISSDQVLRTWCPTLELTATARVKRERRRQVAGAARRKALAEQRRREDAARLARVTAGASASIREATGALGEVIRESAKTRENLLKKDWQPPDSD